MLYYNCDAVIEHQINCVEELLLFPFAICLHENVGTVTEDTFLLLL